MNEEPTIAVLLATYNGEKFIKQQLDSIFSQTYQNFKIYVSDDCSEDKTIEILKEYHTKFPQKLFLSLNRHNIGCVKNFEKLISYCEEDYVALCDQDDIWMENKLEVQINRLLTTELKYGKNIPCMVHSDLKMINDNSVIRESFFGYRKIYLPKERSVNKIISHNGVMGCTIMMNKALSEAVLPFPEKLDVHDYWIALVNELAGKRVTIKESLVLYRIHESNVSNSINKISIQKSFFRRFFNHDKLPFIGLNREKVLRCALERFSDKLNNRDKNIILIFIDYLENHKNFVYIFYKLIQYNIIREDLTYRLKIFIKLIQRQS